MKRILKKYELTIVFMMKVCLYLSLFATFLLAFGVRNWQLLRLSRTAVVTATAYGFVSVVLTAIYGKFDIGKRKSKPIINSLVLATLVTDIFFFFFLQIMNTNPANNNEFHLHDLGLLPIVIVIQISLIILFTYFGNYVYFCINPPERCIVITANQQSLTQLVKAVKRYRKQYQIRYAVRYDEPRIYRLIAQCDTVFMYDIPVKERTQLVDYCYQSSKNVYFNPEIADVLELNSKHVMLDDLSMYSDSPKDLAPEQKFIKRLMDIVISFVAIVVTSPIMIACMIAVKLDDKGKIFFKQKRATKGGKVFSLIKFRTMKESCDNYSATQDDDRITKVGKILRKYRIDELPQFLNILKGDMSVVGPRPEMLSNIYEYTRDLPEFEYRLRVKAGLTGYAQINGKYNTSPKDKLILDLMYIESYSLWKDLQLIFQTLIVLLKSSESTEGFRGNGQPEATFTEFKEEETEHE